MLGRTERSELDRNLLLGPGPDEIIQRDYPHRPHHRLHFGGEFFDDHHSGSSPPPPPSSSSQSSNNRLLDMETCFTADWEWFTLILPKFDPYGIRYTIENSSLRTGYWDMHPKTMIPNQLLANPVAQGWESVKLLYWLVRGGATLSSEQTWEVSCLLFS